MAQESPDHARLRAGAVILLSERPVTRLSMALFFNRLGNVLTPTYLAHSSNPGNNFDLAADR
jgi:hypothetical protein